MKAKILVFLLLMLFVFSCNVSNGGTSSVTDSKNVAIRVNLDQVRSVIIDEYEVIALDIIINDTDGNQVGFATWEKGSDQKTFEFTLPAPAAYQLNVLHKFIDKNGEAKEVNEGPFDFNLRYGYVTSIEVIPGGTLVVNIDDGSFFEVNVLESLGGKVLSDVDVKLVNEEGTVVEEAKTDKDGNAKLHYKYSDYYEKFTIVSEFLEADDYAIGSVQNVTVKNKLDSYTLYCFELGMITGVEHKPVVITDVSYSSDKETWVNLADNFELGSADLKYVKVAAKATAAIMNTAWSGYGIALTFNRTPSYKDHIEPAEYEKESEQNGEYYESVAIFEMDKLDEFLPAGKNYINIVAYDVVNNRTDMRLNGTISGEVTPEGDLAVPNLYSEFTTWGDKMNSKAIYGDYTCYVVHTITTTENVKGYELWKADGKNPSNYRLVVRKSFFSAVTGNIKYREYDPAFTIGKQMNYKVKVFTDDATSKFSKVVFGELLPSYKLSLATPENYAQIDDTTPTLTFKISNTELVEKSSVFYFMVTAREKTGNILGDYYVYFPQNDVFYSRITGKQVTYVTYDSGEFTIETQIALTPGVTYEWDIYGEGYDNAARFQKDFETDYYNWARAISRGNSPYHGSNAVNGSFTFSITNDATNK